MCGTQLASLAHALSEGQSSSEQVEILLALKPLLGAVPSALVLLGANRRGTSPTQPET
jgi:hypothetical protein